MASAIAHERRIETSTGGKPRRGKVKRRRGALVTVRPFVFTVLCRGRDLGRVRIGLQVSR